LKVSIITVVYNGEKYISRVIDSVLSQTHRDIEYIIIDGHSSDNTMDIINSKNDDRLFVISEPDNGMYDALNKGIERCSGELITYINYDDYYVDNNVIEKYVKKFEASQSDVVYANGFFINEEDNIIIESRPLEYNKRYLYTLGIFFIQPTMMWRRDVGLRAGLFNLSYKVSSDYDYFSRILLCADRVDKLEAFTVKFLWEVDSFGAKHPDLSKLEIKHIRKNIGKQLGMFECNLLVSFIDRVRQRLKMCVVDVR